MTDFLVTQAAVEQFASITPPQMRATQTAVEQWAAVNVTNPLMVVTQLAVEQWGLAAAPAAPAIGILLVGL